MSVTSSTPEEDTPPPPLVERLRHHQAAGRLALPPLGEGATPERWRALADAARADLSEGRLIEAHVDAVQILREADRRPTDGALYGVWASEHPRWTVTAEARDDGSWVLSGTKAFCTGAGLVDRALISVVPTGARGDAPALLVDVDLGAVGRGRIDASVWRTPALADTATATVDLTGVEVGEAEVVGEPGWYLARPGFWDGAVGPAACWAGGAQALVDLALAHPPSGPHGRAHLGALGALRWHLSTTLDAAGRQVDARQGQGEPRAARATALTVRHLVDVACAEVQERFARALGPRVLVADPRAIACDQALSVYRRQCHAEVDLEELGDLLLPADGDHRRG